MQLRVIVIFLFPTDTRDGEKQQKNIAEKGRRRVLMQIVVSLRSLWFIVRRGHQEKHLNLPLLATHITGTMPNIQNIFDCGGNQSEQDLVYNDTDPLRLCNVSFWDMSELLGNDPMKLLMQRLNVYITPIIIILGVTGKSSCLATLSGPMTYPCWANSFWWWPRKKTLLALHLVLVN